MSYASACDGIEAVPTRDKWETPQWLFDRLDREFSFDLDAAADPHNAKCEKFLVDALSAEEWPGNGTVWINPPYSTIRDWLPRIRKEASHRDVVILIPSRTETDWWHEQIMKADEIRFIRGRVAFVPPPGLKLPPAGNRPVFASVVVIFRWKAFPRLSSRVGPKVGQIYAPRNSKLLASGQREIPLGEPEERGSAALHATELCGRGEGS